jgi:hypothetical protein
MSTGTRTNRAAGNRFQASAIVAFYLPSTIRRRANLVPKIGRIDPHRAVFDLDVDPSVFVKRKQTHLGHQGQRESFKARLTLRRLNFFPAYRGTGACMTYIADDWRMFASSCP